MKKSVIVDILNGQRGNRDSFKIPEDFHSSEILEIVKKLKEQLSPEAMKLHEMAIEELNKYWCKEMDLYFSEGFKLGLQIGIECAE